MNHHFAVFEISASRLSNSILFVSWLLLFCVVVCLLFLFLGGVVVVFILLSLCTHTLHRSDSDAYMHGARAHAERTHRHYAVGALRV